jgi:hypothetical protein
MSISDVIGELYDEMEESGTFWAGDDEDLIIFALNYLKANLDDAMPGDEEEDEEVE